MRILYAGDLSEGGTCLMRMRALVRMGHDVTQVDARATTPPRFLSRLAGAFWRRLGYPPDRSGLSRRIVTIAEGAEFDVVWVEAVRLVGPDTLVRVHSLQPRTIRVAFIMDDPFSKVVAGWRRFRSCVSRYDIHFVIRNQNTAELRAAGAPRVERYHKGYDPDTHRPVSVPEDFPKRDVLFAGHWEAKREKDIAHLVQGGVDILVAGPDTWRTRGRHWTLIRRSFHLGGFLGDDYARAICSAKIALCFYSQWNRDVENSRMYEIPACGTFMLAERNEENVKMFEPGKEAEFFSSREELLDKTRYYLKHEDARRRIAAAGRERCLRSGYSYHDRLKEILKKVDQLVESR